MRVFIKITFILLFLVTSSVAAQLEEIVQEIESINKKLMFVEAKKETNTTIQNTDKEFKTIRQKRDKLLSKIPPLIINGKYLFSVKGKGKKNSKELEKKIKFYEKKEDFINTTQYRIKRTVLEADIIFYKTIDTIKILSNNFLKQSDIITPLEESKLTLQALSLPVFNEENFLKSGKEIYLQKLKIQKSDLHSKIETYVQIFDYLKQNSDVFSEVDIGYGLNYINGLLPFSSKYFNMGKILTCTCIIILFYMLYLIIKRRNFLIFVFISSKSRLPKNIKSAIIRSTNRPFYPLLLFYCIDICVGIGYHPYATPRIAQIIFDSFYIAILAWIAIGILGGYGIATINNLAQKKDNAFRKEVINLLLKIVYFIVGSIALILILSNLGVNVSAIVASLGIGGLAVALAAKDILANFFASLMLLLDNSFSQGDWIRCGDIEGHVVEIGLRKTTIRTFENAMLFVPNSTLSNEPIINWSRRKVGRRIKMSIGLTYDSPKASLEKCVEEIRQMLLEHPAISKPDDIFKRPERRRLYFKEHIVSLDDLEGFKKILFVYLDSFSASSIDILIYCFAKTVAWGEWLEVKEDIMLKIIDIVENNGLSFAFPTQSLHVESISKKELGESLLKGDEE